MQNKNFGGPSKCPYSVSTENKMNDFDDFQTDAIEMGHFDFVEEMNESIEQDSRNWKEFKEDLETLNNVSISTQNVND